MSWGESIRSGGRTREIEKSAQNLFDDLRQPASRYRPNEWTESKNQWCELLGYWRCQFNKYLMKGARYSPHPKSLGAPAIIKFISSAFQFVSIAFCLRPEGDIEVIAMMTKIYFLCHIVMEIVFFITKGLTTAGRRERTTSLPQQNHVRKKKSSIEKS